MDRRDFLRDSCVACMATLAGTLVGCSSYHYVNGKMVKDGLVIPIELLNAEKNKGSYLVVRHERLRFPICLFKLDDNKYAAIWMQCAHQGAELQAAGNQLVCPAHGSEYDREGRVTQGPATRDLRTFPVSVLENELFIDLRKRRA